MRHHDLAARGHVHPTCPASFRGFTLTELLVVIAIVALLLVLLLPAVQSARESARRTSCGNKLKQLGVAVTAYEALQKVLPISRSQWPEPPYRDEWNTSGQGWICLVLPHLEERSLYDRLSPFFKGRFIDNQGLKHPDCVPLMQTALPVLACPSDADSAKPQTNIYQWEGTPVTVTNYKGVLGDTKVGANYGSVWQGSLPDCHNTVGCNGIFYRNTFQEPVVIAKVRDGASNTLAIGEAVTVHDLHAAALYANGDWASCNVPLNYLPSPPRPEWWQNVQGFRSLHPGGADFARLDGSVQFVAETIDYGLYRALSTRAGGESVTVTEP